MDNKVGSIEKFGFKKVGEWEWDKKKSGEIHFSFDAEEKQGESCVYAFVVKDVVMYIGKTDMTLEQRMNGYKNPGKTQCRNVRGNKQIKDVLKESGNVFIYALRNDEIKQKLKEIECLINFAAGLESGLINEIKLLKWNRVPLPAKIELCGYKFKKVNNWKTEGEKISVPLGKNEREKIGWIYFLASNYYEIIHVGTTERTLETKMGNFKGGHKESTSIRVNEDIKSVLDKNGKVFVYAARFDALIDDKTKNKIKAEIKRALQEEWCE